MFSFLKKKKNRKDTVLEQCGCVCYCPQCKDILNDQANCIDEDFVYYRCNTCNTNSIWTFDVAPCPVLLRVGSI